MLFKKLVCFVMALMLFVGVANAESMMDMDMQQVTQVASLVACGDVLYALKGGDVLTVDLLTGETANYAQLQGGKWRLLGGDVLWAINLLDGQAGLVTVDGFEKQVDLDWAQINENDSIWNAMHFGGKVYLLRRDGNAMAMGSEELVVFDEATGRANVLPAPYALEAVCMADQNVALLWQDLNRITQGETGLVLQQMNAQGELGTILATNLSYQTGALAYDAISDKIYLSGDGELKRVLDGSVETAGYMDVTSALTMPACILKGQYAVLTASGLRTAPLSAELEQVEKLTIFGGTMDEKAQAFMAQNPGLKVSFVPSVLTTGDTIRNDVLSGSSDTDIYVINSLLGLWNLIEKGYVAPIEDAQLIADVQSMYPQISEALMKDGKLYAYPQLFSLGAWSINQKAWDEVGFKEPVPTTFMELLDALEIWNEDYQEDFSEYNFLQLFMGKAQLVTSVLEQYSLMYANGSEPLQFDNPLFIAALDRLRGMELGGIAMEDANEVTPELMAQITEVMMRETLLEQNMTSSIMAGNADKRPTAPMVFEKGEQPAIRAQMLVYVINANSTRKDKAAQFISHMAMHQDDELRVALHPEDNTPVRIKDYDKRLTELRDAVALLEQSVSNAKEEDKKTIEDQLKIANEQLAQMVKSEWLISEQGIADYRALAPYMTLARNAQFLYNNENESATEEINNLLMRFINNQIDAQQLVRELDKKLDMMFKEQ